MEIMNSRASKEEERDDVTYQTNDHLPQMHVEKLCTLDRGVRPTLEWTLHFHILRIKDNMAISIFTLCIVYITKK